MTTGFSVEVVHEPARSLMVLGGAIDLAASTAITAGTRAIRSVGAAEVVIDLSAVSFLDCAGLGLLIEVRAAAAEHGVPTQLFGIPEPVLRLIRLLGLDEDWTPSRLGTARTRRPKRRQPGAA